MDSLKVTVNEIGIYVIPEGLPVNDAARQITEMEKNLPLSRQNVPLDERIPPKNRAVLVAINNLSQEKIEPTLDMEEGAAEFRRYEQEEAELAAEKNIDQQLHDVEEKIDLELDEIDLELDDLDEEIDLELDTIEEEIDLELDNIEEIDLELDKVQEEVEKEVAQEIDESYLKRNFFKKMFHKAEDFIRAGHPDYEVSHKEKAAAAKADAAEKAKTVKKEPMFKEIEIDDYLMRSPLSRFVHRAQDILNRRTPGYISHAQMVEKAREAFSNGRKAIRQDVAEKDVSIDLNTNVVDQAIDLELENEPVRVEELESLAEEKQVVADLDLEEDLEFNQELMKRELERTGASSEEIEHALEQERLDYLERQQEAVADLDLEEDVAFNMELMKRELERAGASSEEIKQAVEQEKSEYFKRQQEDVMYKMDTNSFTLPENNLVQDINYGIGSGDYAQNRTYTEEVVAVESKGDLESELAELYASERAEIMEIRKLEREDAEDRRRAEHLKVTPEKGLELEEDDFDLAISGR